MMARRDMHEVCPCHHIAVGARTHPISTQARGTRGAAVPTPNRHTRPGTKTVLVESDIVAVYNADATREKVGRSMRSEIRQ